MLALMKKGLDTQEKVRAASDEDLLKVDGLDAEGVAELRVATKEG